MKYEASTIEPTTPPGKVNVSTGPHFEHSRKKKDRIKQAPFDETVESCHFEHDDNLRPDALLSQKIMMLGAVTIPLIGVAIGAAITWQYGFMGWPYLAMMLLGWVATSLGITIGFHRLMSHRSFETRPWIRAAWMCLGAMSVEGAPLIWCAVHRRHHSCSDQEGDPHSPHLHEGGYWNMLKGLIYAQIGWLFAGYWSEPNLQKYVPDLMKDKMLVVLSRYYVVFIIISLLIPAGIGYLIDGGQGAWLGFLWGGLVRVFLTHHNTWSINSICHVFGRRDFESHDHSTNNLVCGVLACGEGWHNNHHAFPSSARHGLQWWQFDLSWLIIRAMMACGLAWNIKLPSARAMEAKRIH